MPTLVLAKLLTVVAQLVPLAARAPELPRTTWKEIAARPDLHYGRLTRLVVQHRSLETDWEPFLTRFDPSSYLAVRAWADEQQPWIRVDYERPVARLFVRRGTRAARLFAEARPHDRIVVACEVKALLLGLPWIEVVCARRMRKYIPEGSVLHAARALEFVERQAWPLAQDQLDRALAAPLPVFARGKLEILKREVDRLEALAKVDRAARLRRVFAHDRPSGW